MIKNGIFTFKNLSAFPELIHGFSTRKFADLKIRPLPSKNQNLALFLINFGVREDQLVVGKQVHGRKVAVVDKQDRGSVVLGVDGLVTKEANLFLGVNTADCLPIFFYDPRKGIVAICHAGWLGSSKGIATKTLELIKGLGSQAEDVIVGVGPHIKACCYSISRERVKFVQREPKGSPDFIRKGGPKFYLDLTSLNLCQLRNAGIREKNIEIAPHCTFCGGREFFSRRRLGRRNSSEMLGIIGVRT